MVVVLLELKNPVDLIFPGSVRLSFFLPFIMIFANENRFRRITKSCLGNQIVLQDIYLIKLYLQFLQEDGTYKVVSGSDFTITRVAFRDNSSKYYINDRTSNFTEVTRKLKGKGVDLDNNRFLILQVRYCYAADLLCIRRLYWSIRIDALVICQGEVEQISLMKPKAQGPHDEGFLEYLEDIIGTDKYVEKIDESFKQ